jgi:hypothetical protein
MSVSKNTVLFIFQNNVSETGFYLRLQVKPTQLGPIDRASPDFRKELDHSNNCVTGSNSATDTGLLLSVLPK